MASNLCGKKDNAGRIILDELHAADLTIEEAAQHLNLSRKTMSERLKYPERLTLGDLRNLRRITYMSDLTVTSLIRGDRIRGKEVKELLALMLREEE